MATLTFDSMALVSLLERHGLSRQQAEGVTEAVAQSHSLHMQTLDTLKTDLGDLREKSKDALVALEQTVQKRFADVDLRFAGVDKRFVQLEAQIERVRKDLLIKVGAMIFAAAGAVVAALRYLPPLA